MVETIKEIINQEPNISKIPVKITGYLEAELSTGVSPVA